MRGDTYRRSGRNEILELKQEFKEPMKVDVL
jgi:hypothetical protein